MRVLILGPIVNDKSSGGVAVFDEGLYHGFKDLGDEVNIISLAKSSRVDNFVVGKGNNNIKSIYTKFGRIAKLIKSFKPDIVISSVQYSIGIKKYKRNWKKAKYIQVLHGFPCQINGWLKAWAVNSVARYSRKHFDYVVAVSFLSYAVNKKINRICCDKVIHNGCVLTPNYENLDRVYDFVYVGRLFRDKEVEMIGEAFKLIKEKNPNIRVAVAGYGELESLFTDGKLSKCGIDFCGKLTQSQVRELLERSKFFISMNPLEPFGTVFNEAVMNGCNIITQSSNGSMALFLNKDYFHCADCVNAKELAIRLLEVLDEFSPIPFEEKEKFVAYMSFKRTAQEYKDLIAKEE